MKRPRRHPGYASSMPGRWVAKSAALLSAYEYCPVRRDWVVNHLGASHFCSLAFPRSAQVNYQNTLMYLTFINALFQRGGQNEFAVPR